MVEQLSAQNLDEKRSLILGFKGMPGARECSLLPLLRRLL